MKFNPVLLETNPSLLWKFLTGFLINDSQEGGCGFSWCLQTLAFSAVFAKLKIFTWVWGALGTPIAVSRWHVIWLQLFKVPPPQKNTAFGISRNFQHKNLQWEDFPKENSFRNFAPKKDFPVRTEEPMIMILCCLKNSSSESVIWERHLVKLQLWCGVCLFHPFQKTSEKIKMQSPAHHPESPMGRRFFF